MAPDNTQANIPGYLKGLYLVAGIAAIIALLLGMWDVFVEKEGGKDWVMQLVMPLVLLFLVLALYMRRKKQNA